MLDALLKRRPEFRHLNVIAYIPWVCLCQDMGGLSSEMQAYIKQSPHVEFLIYSTVSKSPLLGIEVGGYSFHSNEDQQRRDALKDAFFAELGLPLLRLSTKGSNEEERVEQLLLQLMNA